LDVVIECSLKNIPTYSLIYITCLLTLSYASHGQTQLFKTYIDSYTQATFEKDDFQTQIARLEIDRPMWVTGVKIHVQDRSRGKFDMRFFGHEAGSSFPVIQKDLVPPIRIKKRRNDNSIIEVKLDKPVYLDQDQCFLWFENFKGDVHITKDVTPVGINCKPAFGGSYHTTLLISEDGIKAEKNESLQVELIVQYEKFQATIFQEYSSKNNFLFPFNGNSISWGNVNKSPNPELLVGGKLHEYKEDLFIKSNIPLWEDAPRTLSGNAFVDMDNDGDLDILLFGKNESYLHINENDTFHKRSINLPRLPALSGFSFADINYDGYMDLLVVQLWGLYPVPAANFLFENDTKLGFIDITKKLYPNHINELNFPSKTICNVEELTTHLPNENQNKRSRACQFVDYDLDGDMDIYISNYFLEQDEMFENLGDGTFLNIMDSLQIDQNLNGYNHTTGLDWADLDNDGDLDLLLPRLAHPKNVIDEDHQPTTIYKNNGINYSKALTSHSIEYEETHAGSFFIDVNNDGWMDVITNAFYECRYSDLYIQDSAFHFSNRTLQSGLQKLSDLHDGCPVDYNLDGKMDIVLGSNSAFHLFENIDTTLNTNWIKIKLNSLTGNRLGIGSLVKVYTRENTYTQMMTSGRGQMMQTENTLHFGLGHETEVDKIEVYWYGAQKLTYFNPSINQVYTLIENGNIINNLELD